MKGGDALMRTVWDKVLLVAALAVLVAACGGPDDASYEDDYGDGSEALTVNAQAYGAPAAATQAAHAQGTALVVDVAPGGRATDGAPTATRYVPVQPGGYRIDGDSSPDPIPARNAADRLDDRISGLDAARVVTLADCERIPDAQGRANCFLLVAHGGR